MSTSMAKVEMEHYNFVENGEFVCIGTDVKINPFKNLLEMIAFYHGIAERNDPDELDAFLDNEYSKSRDQYSKIVNAEDIDYFIIHSIVDSRLEKNSQSKNELWMKFDEEALKALLQKPFFDEYNAIVIHRENGLCEGTESQKSEVTKQMKPFKRNYGMLELYTYTKLQAQAACVLSDDRTNMMWYLWCFHDVIE